MSCACNEPNCIRCRKLRSRNGITGATGATGPVGPPGPTGSAGLGAGANFSAFRTDPQSVAPGANVVFDNLGPNTGLALDYDPLTGILSFLMPGSYQISYALSSADGSAQAVFNNGVDVPVAGSLTTWLPQADPQLHTVTFAQEALAGQTIRIVNAGVAPLAIAGPNSGFFSAIKLS